ATKSCARPRSSMNPHERVRLRHALDAMNAALGFIAGRSRSDLDSDRMLSFALVQAIQIVGEAASKVSAETRAEMPDLPWAAMVGMRNRLVHAYFDVNYDILWDTVSQAVPPLAKRLALLYCWSMIPRVEPEGMLFRKPVSTPDQVRGRLFRDHAL